MDYLDQWADYLKVTEIWEEIRQQAIGIEF